MREYPPTCLATEEKERNHGVKRKKRKTFQADGENLRGTRAREREVTGALRDSPNSAGDPYPPGVVEGRTVISSSLKRPASSCKGKLFYNYAGPFYYPRELLNLKGREAPEGTSLEREREGADGDLWSGEDVPEGGSLGINLATRPRTQRGKKGETN